MISWILEHFTDLLAIYGSVVAIATIIVKYTKTDKDDKILNKIIAFFDLFSTAFSKSDKELLEKAVAKNGKK